MGNLTSLRELYLDNNNLVEIPPSLCNLKSLEYLSLENNNLETIPKCIDRLPKLETLIISGNSLGRKYASYNFENRSCMYQVKYLIKNFMQSEEFYDYFAERYSEYERLVNKYKENQISLTEFVRDCF